MIESTRIKIENMNGEVIELTLEEAKTLQRELNEFFEATSGKEYIPYPYTPVVPWGEPYITYTYVESE
jgi:hypothetical protein